MPIKIAIKIVCLITSLISKFNDTEFIVINVLLNLIKLNNFLVN